MKKKTLTNVLVKTIVILLIVLVSLISFLGIYKRDLNTWKNLLPDFNLSKELSEVRTFGFIVDDSTESVESTSSEDSNTTEETTTEDEATVDEEATTEDVQEETETSDETDTEEAQTEEVPVNDPSVLNSDNYNKSKSIIEKRLKTFGVVDTVVTVNSETGKIDVDAPFGRAADYIVSLVTQKGELEIIDTETEEILMTNDMISKVTAYYMASETSSNTSSSLYDLGIKLDLTSQGQAKLNEMSKKYIETTDENGEATQKTITVKIDGETKYETYFSTEGTYTYLAIPLYQSVDATDTETFNSNYNECLVYQVVLNEGVLPVKYEVSTGTYMESNMSENFLLYLVIIGIVILLIISLIIIKKFTKKGLMAFIIEIGYIAILLLLLRYANVSLTLAGIFMVLFMILLNYMLLLMLIKDNKAQQILKFILYIIPFVIAIIVSNFAKDINLLSVGMVGFWGLISCVYTWLVSLLLLNTKN